MKRILTYILAALLLSTSALSVVSCDFTDGSSDTDSLPTDGATTTVAVESPDSQPDDRTPSDTQSGSQTEDRPDEQTTDGEPVTTPSEPDDPSEETEPDYRPDYRDETDSPAETDDPSVGRAPDFAMLDWDGNVVNLSDLVDKPIVLNFWASWCPPCKAEMPDFEEAYKKYGEDVVFIMLNLTDGSVETIATAKAHVASCGYTFPVYFDTGYQGATAYEVSAIPQTCFINANGQLVSTSVGMMDGETLESWIGLLLGK